MEGRYTVTFLSPESWMGDIGILINSVSSVPSKYMLIIKFNTSTFTLVYINIFHI